MKFYSHSDGTELVEHSKTVAERTRCLIKQIESMDPYVAFLTGFFHDVGKLNPYYQEAFSKGMKPYNEEYVPLHSVFSAILAEKLLYNYWPSDTQEQYLATLVSCVDGHHSGLNKSLFWLNRKDSQKITETISGINKSLKPFFSDALDRVRYLNSITSLQEENIPDIQCLEQAEPKKKSRFDTADYLSFFKASVLFSALLQADRSAASKQDLKMPKLDIKIDTGSMLKDTKNLSSIRSEFQQDMIKKIDCTEKFLAIEAPTGIGKTKLFLDLANKFMAKRAFERFIYFSPLLALTDDFEDKFKKSISKEEYNECLIYTSLYKGNIKNDTKGVSEEADQDKPGWDFNIESFNKKIIITTTQRLLISLFSNYHKDKIKLISLKNSFLVIDEAQTIPAELLAPTIKILKYFAEKAKSTIIFITATLPKPFDNIKRFEPEKNILDSYNAATQKNVYYVKKNEDNLVEDFRNLNGRSLLMLNTRKKSYTLAKKLEVTKVDFEYLTSGIRVAERKTILEKIKKDSANCRVISTQALEAGVDISFGTIYRELAPLDNIVQVMGRLNREADKGNPANLFVFKLDENHAPYGDLEINETEKFFNRSKLCKSGDLLKYLKNSYYEEIYIKNMKNKEISDGFEEDICNMEFEKVNEKFNSILRDNTNITMYIPDNESTLNELNSYLSNNALSRFKSYEKFRGITAELPYKKLECVKHLLDPDLMKKGIYVPTEDNLNDIYDCKFGLDKWINNK